MFIDITAFFAMEKHLDVSIAFACIFCIKFVNKEEQMDDVRKKYKKRLH